MSDDLVIVNVGTCRCDGSPHADGDTVSLRPKLTTPMGAAAMAVLSGTSEPGELESALTAVFLQLGIAAWSFTDTAGLPVAVNAASIERLLPWTAGGWEIANRVFDLYGEDLFAPLAPRRSKPSRNGLTASSMSATRLSGSKRPKRRSPSSAVGTDTSSSVAPV